MFDLVSDGITTATGAFLGGDLEVARRLIAEDLLIDELQQRIETMVEQRLTSCEPISPEEARSTISTSRSPRNWRTARCRSRSRSRWDSWRASTSASATTR